VFLEFERFACGPLAEIPGFHPDSKLAATPIPIKFLKDHRLQLSFFASDEMTVTKDQLKEVGVSAGDGVFILGFPMNLAGQQRNYVTVRQGQSRALTSCWKINRQRSYTLVETVSGCTAIVNDVLADSGTLLARYRKASARRRAAPQTPAARVAASACCRTPPPELPDASLFTVATSTAPISPAIRRAEMRQDPVSLGAPTLCRGSG
jgi:hypothetical protein